MERDNVGQMHNAGGCETPTKNFTSDPSAEKSQGLAPEQWNERVLVELFRYHNPRPNQLPKYSAIRSAAKHFAEVMLQNTPVGDDQRAALRKIREAVMTANAAIALDGLSL